MGTINISFAGPSDWLKFVSDMTSALAWPAVAVFFALMFRREILRLLDRLRSFSWGGAAASFEERLRKAEEEADELGALPPAQPEPANAPQHEVQATPLPPRFLILEAWQRIERELLMLAMRAGVSLSRGKSAIYLTKILRRNGVLDSKTTALLNDLRELRNAAVQETDQPIQITQEDAVRYQYLADEVVTRLISLPREQGPA